MAFFNVSQSKIKLFRQCTQAYHYKYVEQLRKRAPSRPLQFGTIVHEMHDAIANGKDPFSRLAEIEKEQSQLFREEIEEYGDLVGDLEVIMQEYLAYYADDEMVFVKFQGKYAEHDLSVEIDDGILLKMRIDGLVKSKGLKWLIEHKNHRSIPNEDERWRNLQSAVYLRALSMIGVKDLDGVVWNYIRSKSPTKPQVLKNGGLSKRQIDTLPTQIRKTLDEHGLKEKNYRTLIEQATQNRESYFLRVYTPINSKVIDSIFKDAVKTAREMRDSHGKKRVRNIGIHCSWCDFEAICRAALTGSDVKFVKERQYVIEEEKPEIPDLG